MSRIIKKMFVLFWNAGKTALPIPGFYYLLLKRAADV